MERYVKKPVAIEAMQYTGRNTIDILDSCEAAKVEFYPKGECYALVIYTLDGGMIARPGDYIIKGVNGDFYLCGPDVFEKTYERVEA